MSRATPNSWGEAGSRRDLPTYVGGWVATLAWLATVGTTVGDAPFNVLITVLTSTGFAVSFWLRGFENTEQWPAIKRGTLGPSVVVRTVFMIVFVLPGLINIRPFNVLVPDVARATTEWQIGTGFMWAMALYSFGLVSDGLVAFGSVLGLSMMGLMASSNVNAEIGVLFLFYLLGNVLMLSNMTLAHHSPQHGERTNSAALARWFGDQIIVAGIAVALTALLGIAIAFVLQAISPRGLVPYLKVPGTPGGPSQLSHSFAAFDDRMELGVGNPALAPTPVFVVTGARDDLLWRRRVYDKYAARMWQTAATGGMSAGVDPSGRVRFDDNADLADLWGADAEMTARVRTLIDRASLAAPPLVTSIFWPSGTAEDRVYLDRYNNPDVRPPANAVIEVTCRLVDPPVDRLGAAQDVDPTDYQTLLAVPSTARRIVDRTVQTIIRAGDGPYARATAIRGWLETQCRYDANIRIPEQQYDDAMDYYLVERRGACDLIASAVALMARSAGIPARVAVGYAQGEPQPDGSLIIRTNMAHAWAELYFEGCGWVAFNPAVPGLEAGAGGSGDPTAATGARRRANLGGLVCLAIGVWLIVYGIAQYRRRRPGFAADPSGEVARAYHAALRALRRASMPRRSYETPRGYWRRLAAEQPEAGWLEPFECLTSLYERQRYGLGPLDATDLSTAEAKAGETTENLRREQRSRRRPKRTARGAS